MPEPYVLKVDRRAVEAAKLLMALDQREGKVSDEAVVAIANAKPLPRDNPAG